MRVKLLRDARINHKVGEIVEVSPAECNFLVSVGSAVEVAVRDLSKVELAEKIPKKTTTTTKKTKK